MRIVTKFLFPLRLVLFCLFLFAINCCGRGTSLIGSYIAEEKDSPHCQVTSLELKENGVGFWTVGEDEVDCSWYVKDNQLRLLTKNGGVIVGIFDNDIIHLTLPGSKELSFKKVK